LQRVRFLTRGDAGKRLAEKPSTQNVPPICWQRVRCERVEREDSLGQSHDGGYRRLGVALENCAIGLYQEKIGVRGDRVERMPSRQPDPGQEITPAARCRRLSPDKSAAGAKARLEGLLHLFVLTQNAPVPEGGLEDVVQRSLDSLVKDVIFADQAENGRVERRDMPLPLSERPLPIVRLLVRDLREVHAAALSTT
jgi:hypothetical protein